MPQFIKEEKWSLELCDVYRTQDERSVNVFFKTFPYRNHSGIDVTLCWPISVLLTTAFLNYDIYIYCTDTIPG